MERPPPEKKEAISYNENPQQDSHNRGSAVDNGFPSFFAFVKLAKKNRVGTKSIEGK